MLVPLDLMCATHQQFYPLNGVEVEDQRTAWACGEFGRAIVMNAVAAGTRLDAARCGPRGHVRGLVRLERGGVVGASLVVAGREYACLGLRFVAAMGMMDALVGTASAGPGPAGKVGTWSPRRLRVPRARVRDVVRARVAVNGGAGAGHAGGQRWILNVRR